MIMNCNDLYLSYQQWYLVVACIYLTKKTQEFQPDVQLGGKLKMTNGGNKQGFFHGWTIWAALFRKLNFYVIYPMTFWKKTS